MYIHKGATDWRGRYATQPRRIVRLLLCFLLYLVTQLVFAFGKNVKAPRAEREGGGIWSPGGWITAAPDCSLCLGCLTFGETVVGPSRPSESEATSTYRPLPCCDEGPNVARAVSVKTFPGLWSVRTRRRLSQTTPPVRVLVDGFKENVEDLRHEIGIAVLPVPATLIEWQQNERQTLTRAWRWPEPRWGPCAFW